MAVSVGAMAFSSKVLVPEIKTGAGIGFLILVLLILYCLREIVRIIRGRRAGVPRVDWLADYQCSRCQSTDIERLPENGVSPITSYQCSRCGMGLITAGTKFAFLFIAVLAAAVFVVALFTVGEQLDTSIRFGWIALIVLGYSIRQLFYGSLRRIDRDSESTL